MLIMKNEKYIKSHFLFFSIASIASSDFTLLSHLRYRPNILPTIAIFSCCCPYFKSLRLIFVGFICINIDWNFLNYSERFSSGFMTYGLKLFFIFLSSMYSLSSVMHFLPWVWTTDKGLKDRGELGSFNLFFTEWFGKSYRTGYLLTYGCFITRFYFLRIIFWMSRGDEYPIRDGFYSTCLCIIFLFKFIWAFVKGGNKSISFC